jgi:formate dehydrogenase subunit beta
MSVSAASILSQLTRRGAEGRIGAVLRSCELKALRELAKLKQVDLSHILTIGIDCLGTYEVEDFVELVKNGMMHRGQLPLWKESDAPHHPGLSLRTACQICLEPAAPGADMSLQYLGGERALHLEAGEELGELLGLSQKEELEHRKELLTEIVTHRAEAQGRALSEFLTGIAGIPELMAELSACIRCHNCTVACPLCYCRECLFRTPAFDYEGYQYLDWAQRRGAIRLPADTLLFHLTRLAHMGTSCVGCGMCESACPHNLPLTLLFQGVGERLQALFGYVPGRDVEEEIPLAAFREDELAEVAK